MNDQDKQIIKDVWMAAADDFAKSIGPMSKDNDNLIKAYMKGVHMATAYFKPQIDALKKDSLILMAELRSLGLLKENK